MSEDKRSRASRFENLVPPDHFKWLPNEAGAWHESGEEIRAGFAWGRKREELLEWVRYQMIRRLTKLERECVEMHYFQGMSYKQIESATGMESSTAHRAIQRGIFKLRRAARSRRCRPEGIVMSCIYNNFSVLRSTQEADGEDGGSSA